MKYNSKYGFFVEKSIKKMSIMVFRCYYINVLGGFMAGFYLTKVLFIM